MNKVYFTIKPKLVVFANKEIHETVVAMFFPDSFLLKLLAVFAGSGDISFLAVQTRKRHFLSNS